MKDFPGRSHLLQFLSNLLCCTVTDPDAVLLKNPEIIMSILPTVMNTAFARHFIKIWSNYALLWFGIIFTDYVEITGPNILMSLRDLAEVIIYNIIYGINYLLQTWLTVLPIIILLLLNIVLEVVFMILRYVFPQVSIVFTVIEKIVTTVITLLIPTWAFFMPVPPDPLMDSRGAPTQNFVGYAIDIFNCTNAEDTCTTRDDCSGGAECRCDDDTAGEWRAMFFEFKSDKPCTGKTGRCICFFQFACNTRYQVLPITNLVVPDCSRFGYDLRGQVWYASKGSFLDRWWTLTRASMDNFVATTKFMIRSLLAGWNVFVSTAIFIGILLSIGGVILFVFRRMKWFFTVAFFGLVLFYWTPIYTEWIASEMIPFLQDLADAKFQKYLFDVWYFDDWIAWFLDLIYVDEFIQLIVDYITFPNATPSNPVGSPDLINGEFHCFVIGFFSGVPGLLFFLPHRQQPGNGCG